MAAAGTMAGLAQITGVPAGAQSQPLLLILPAIATVAVGLAVLLRGRSRALAGAVAGIPLGVTGVLQIGALTASQLPPGLPALGLRTVTAVMLGAGAGGLVAAARAGLDAMPDVGPAVDAR